MLEEDIDDICSLCGSESTNALQSSAYRIGARKKSAPHPSRNSRRWFPRNNPRRVPLRLRDPRRPAISVLQPSIRNASSLPAGYRQVSNRMNGPRTDDPTVRNLRKTLTSQRFNLNGATEALGLQQTGGVTCSRYTSRAIARKNSAGLSSRIDPPGDPSRTLCAHLPSR